MDCLDKLEGFQPKDFVFPRNINGDIVSVKQQSRGEFTLHSQAVTVVFIQDGNFNRHLRRMRMLYAEKFRLLVQRYKVLEPWSKLHSGGAGMHIELELLVTIGAEQAAAKLKQKGIVCSVLQ